MLYGYGIQCHFDPQNFPDDVDGYLKSMEDFLSKLKNKGFYLNAEKNVVFVIVDLETYLSEIPEDYIHSIMDEFTSNNIYPHGDIYAFYGPNVEAMTNCQWYQWDNFLKEVQS